VAEDSRGADFTIGKDGTCRLHPQLARTLVKSLGQVVGIRPVIGELMNQLGHKPPSALPHRSKAWLAQRGLMA